MLKLYYDLMSQPCRAMFIFLRKCEIPFEKCKIDLMKGEHKTDEFATVNALQLVPAIDDNGFKLAESVAIMRYLCRQYGDKIPDNWYPKNSKDQARVDEYLEWQHINTRLSCAMYFQTKFLMPKITGTAPNEKRVAQFQDRMENCLDHLENTWLKDRSFIGGPKISIADILAITELDQPGIAGYDVYDGHPNLTAWFSRVKTELNPHYEDATVIVNKIKAKNKAGPSTTAKL